MDEVWSSGCEYNDAVLIRVPFSIFCAMKYLASKTDLEYSIVMGIRDIEGGFQLEENYRIPKQEVARTFIDYKEDCPEPCVIHRHPNNMNVFSTVDAEYINQNFKVSLLFTDIGGFVNGQAMIKFGDSTYVKQKVKIEVMDCPVEITGTVKVNGTEINLPLSSSNLVQKPLVEAYISQLNIDMSNITERVYTAPVVTKKKDGKQLTMEEWLNNPSYLKEGDKSGIFYKWVDGIEWKWDREKIDWVPCK